MDKETKRQERYQEIVNNVENLIKDNPGMTISDACDKLNVHFSTYYSYRKKLNGSVRKPTKRRSVSRLKRLKSNVVEINTQSNDEGDHHHINFCPECGASIGIYMAAKKIAKRNPKLLNT